MASAGSTDIVNEERTREASTLREAGPGAGAGRGGRFSVLRSGNFATLWVAGLVSNAGAQMQGVASAWLVLQLTNAPLALGLQGLCFALPMTLLPPLGGAVADRCDRVTVLKWAQTFQVIQPLLMAAILASGHLRLWVLYADTLAAATIYAFTSPAQQALVPALVSREELLGATPSTPRCGPPPGWSAPRSAARCCSRSVRPGSSPSTA